MINGYWCLILTNRMCDILCRVIRCEYKEYSFTDLPENYLANGAGSVGLRYSKLVREHLAHS